MKIKTLLLNVTLVISLISLGYGTTPLPPPKNYDAIGKAAATNNWPSVEEYLSETDDITSSNSALDVLFFAIQNNQEHIIDLLIDKNVLAVLDNSDTLKRFFGISLTYNNYKFNDQLIKSLDDFNNIDFLVFPLDSYLSTSIIAKDKESISYLLKLGVDINAQVKRESLSPLAISLALGYRDIFWYLIDSGADVSESTISNELMGYASKYGYIDVITYILGFDYDVNLPFEEGVTPLMMAIFGRDNKENTIRLLLQEGADPCVRDEEGINSIEYADQVGYSSLEFENVSCDLYR